MELLESKRLNVAIISPNRQAYSETFIQAQKEYLPQRIFFYYDGVLPRKIENGSSLNPTFFQILWSKIVNSQRTLLGTNVENSFKRNGIDVVLAQFGPTGAAVASICKKLNLPLVVHFHGADAYVKNHIDSNDSYQLLFKVASAIIVVSDDMKEQLLRLGASQKKIVQTCYGPREDFFQARPSYEQKQFLSVGRFVDKKAPYLTLLAFAQVAKRHPDASIIMVGDGPLSGVCKNLVKYLKIEHLVQFKGVLAHGEVCKLMQTSRCFVQHSITGEDGDKEGSPVAIIEAAAAGLPVIATRHAGINFSVVHGKTGFLVNEGDVDGMANFMINICNDLSLAMRLGEAARSHIRENASMDKYISDISNIIVNAYNSNELK